MDPAISLHFVQDDGRNKIAAASQWTYEVTTA
jgi:hypothetical protein